MWWKINFPIGWDENHVNRQPVKIARLRHICSISISISITNQQPERLSFTLSIQMLDTHIAINLEDDISFRMFLCCSSKAGTLDRFEESA